MITHCGNREKMSIFSVKNLFYLWLRSTRIKTGVRINDCIKIELNDDCIKIH